MGWWGISSRSDGDGIITKRAVRSLSKGYKIKRSGSRIYGRNRNRSRSPFAVAGAAVLLVGLFVLGWLAYPHVYRLLTEDPEPLPLESGVSDADPAESSEPEKPAPATPLSQAVKGAYAPDEVMRDPAALETFLQEASAAGCNLLVFDAKDENGVVRYQTENEIAIETEAVAEGAFDLSAAAALMERYQVVPAARVYTFKDHAASRLHPSFSVHYLGEGGMLWLDDTLENGGRSWLNPYDVEAQDYNISLAEECVRMGARMVIAGGVQFPDTVAGIEFASYGDEQGVPRAQALSGFVSRIKSAVEAAGADFAVSQPVSVLMGLGGEEIWGSPAAYPCALVADCRPALWGAGNAAAGLEAPVLSPYDTVLSALQAAMQNIGAGKLLIACVQGYTDPDVPEYANKTYTDEDVAAQMDAVRDAGMSNYILFSSKP